MLKILKVAESTVRGCAGNLKALWDMVRAHPDRDVLLNNGKKWLRKVGDKYFHDESQAPSQPVAFAWDTEKLAWSATSAGDKQRKRKASDSVQPPRPTRYRFKTVSCSDFRAEHACDLNSRLVMESCATGSARLCGAAAAAAGSRGGGASAQRVSCVLC